MAKTKIHGEYLDPSVISGQTQVTAVGADSMLIFDATDNALKKALLSDLIETVGATPSFTSATISGDLTVDTSTLKVDSSNNRVGIGTTSPTHQFHIKGPTSAYAAMRIESTSTSHGSIINMGDSSDDDYGQIVQFASSAGEGGRMRFIAGATETMNLRGGNVGIGISSPDGTCHIHSGSAGTITAAASGNNLVVENSGAVGMSLLFDDAANNAYGNIYWGNETDGSADGRITYFGSTYVTAADRQSMAFRTANTERMRITSAGNVGIGTTSPTGAGKILHFNSSSNVADFHITNSVTGATATDGFILRVTDPANVEYINREATHQIFYQAGSEKLRIQSGGGISFNGDTAAANALDDYEEGTWTPALTGNSAATFSVRNGRYTKVGNLVRARCAIKLSAWTSNGTEVVVTGLPYATVASGYDHDWGAVHISSKPTDHVVVCGVSGSQVFFRRQDVSSADNGVVGGHVDADTGIMFTVVYQTA